MKSKFIHAILMTVATFIVFGDSVVDGIEFKTFSTRSYNGHTYTLVKEPKLPWDQAVAACASKNLVLASTRTTAELNFVKQFTQSNWVGQNGWQVWLWGQKNGAGTPIWLENGQSIQKDFFGKGEPNNVNGGKENCIGLYNNLPTYFGGNDALCSRADPFLCRTRVLPATTTTTTTPKPTTTTPKTTTTTTQKTTTKAAAGGESGNFVCPSEGNWIDPTDPAAYHVCIDDGTGGGGYEDYEFRCPGQLIYCQKFQGCSTQSECDCPATPPATQKPPTVPTTTSTTSKVPVTTTTANKPTTTTINVPVTTTTTTKVPVTTTTTTKVPVITTTTTKAPVTTTTVRPVTKPPPIGGGFSCLNRECGSYEDANDCGGFYVCGEDKSVAVAKRCPHGLHFNKELQLCDLAQFAGCSAPATTTTTTTSKPVPVTTTTTTTTTTTQKPTTTTTTAAPAFSCSSEGYFADRPNGCQAFCRCVGNGSGGYTKYNYTCPAGTIWCQSNVACSFSYQCAETCGPK